MKEIVLFAGTTEGRKLSEYLAASEMQHTVCVATEYGEFVLEENPFRELHCGRMDREQIRAFLSKKECAAVVDATHPYAEMITENIRAAMEGMEIPYLRLKRELSFSEDAENVRRFATNEACAEALEQIEGNILLTTGSKELEKYCISENVKSRLYVRVLPSLESISLCEKQGVKGKQIIAMQGPFTTEMNEAMIRQFGISCLITKQSGKTGGYSEKLEAAEKAGISVFVIGQPDETGGYSFSELCRELGNICGKSIGMEKKMEIVLAGIGMGNKSSLTREVYEKIEEADILLGAERMLEPYRPKLEKKPFYQEQQIIPYLQELNKKYFAENLKIMVLFSGDSGFYSGCQALYNALQKEIRIGTLQADVRIMPGISSVSYLAACIGENYHEAAVCSLHGKEICNLADRLRAEKKTFLLMSGVKDVNRLGEELVKAGMNQCEIIAGYNLSYPNQKIEKMTPLECTKLTEEGLYTCFVKNRYAAGRNLTHGMADAEFIRDKVPMTKEEVREVSICKLKLYQKAIVLDIGSGTGSLAVEMAKISPDIQVYAVEQKSEALTLIERNKEKFQVENVTLIRASAPEGMEKLPKATHAFIGGSGGKLKEILRVLYEVNPRMRVVMNAISMETICELKEILTVYPIKNEEIVQIQVSRVKKSGKHHLMQAENPVWICAFDFWDNKE